MTPLPPEIRVETLEDGFRYTLPTRRFVRLAGKSAAQARNRSTSARSSDMRSAFPGDITTQLSDPAHETQRLQQRRDGRVRCSAWLGRDWANFVVFMFA